MGSGDLGGNLGALERLQLQRGVGMTDGVLETKRSFWLEEVPDTLPSRMTGNPMMNRTASGKCNEEE